MDRKRFQNILKNQYRNELIPMLLEEEKTTLKEVEDAFFQNNDIASLYLFARYIPSASKEKIARFLLQTNNFYYILKFAMDFPSVLPNEFTKKIVSSKNASFLFQYALLVPTVDSLPLEKALLDLMDAEYLYLFAYYIKGCKQDLLQEALAKSKNAKYIYLYLRNITFTDALAVSLLQTKNICYIEKFLKTFYPFLTFNIYEVLSSLKEEAFSYPLPLFLKEVITHSFYSEVLKEKTDLEKIALLKKWMEEKNIDGLRCYAKILIEKTVDSKTAAKADLEYQKILLQKIPCIS